MKKTLITVGIIIGIFLLIVATFVSPYNSMVFMDEQVTKQWAQVENVYQRRADLIPNLVNTVKGYAEHEKSTLEGVVEARSKATAVQIDANNLDAASIQKFNEAQGELTQALSRLLMLREAYPDLKANQNFLELQAQLEGTENRIAVERMKFNEEAQKYNSYIRSFPKNLIASMFNFERKAYFESQEGAEVAPTVEF